MEQIKRKADQLSIVVASSDLSLEPVAKRPLLRHIPPMALTELLNQAVQAANLVTAQSRELIRQNEALRHELMELKETHDRTVQELHQYKANAKKSLQGTV